MENDQRMKNLTKLVIGVTLFGLLYGGSAIWYGESQKDSLVTYLGMISLFGMAMFHVALFVGKREKKIKEWLNK